MLVGPTWHPGAGWSDLAFGCLFNRAGIRGAILDWPNNYSRQREAHHPSMTRRQSNGSIDPAQRRQKLTKMTSVQKAEDIILLLINNQKILVSDPRHPLLLPPLIPVSLILLPAQELHGEHRTKKACYS
jgi:hypothetical protein